MKSCGHRICIRIIIVIIMIKLNESSAGAAAARHRMRPPEWSPVALRSRRQTLIDASRMQCDSDIVNVPRQLHSTDIARHSDDCLRQRRCPSRRRMQRTPSDRATVRRENPLFASKACNFRFFLYFCAFPTPQNNGRFLLCVVHIGSTRHALIIYRLQQMHPMKPIIAHQ